MQALVLGGRGAVGRVVVDDLRQRGHEVEVASRSGAVRLDLAAPDAWPALRRHAAGVDVVVNASGLEDPTLARVVTDTGAAFVDISATGSYLEALRAEVRAGQHVLLGAGLAPGLSTLLVASLEARAGDDVDLAIVLGTGERHGPQAVAWTAGLAGHDLHGPPEPHRVRNLREQRLLPSPTGRRRHVRADFPDHVLLADRGAAVRSYLAVGGRSTTAALGLVGRWPWLAPLVSRAPHVGDARWSLVALHRRSGRRAAARGEGQSRTTGLLTSRAVEALVRVQPGYAVSTAELMTLDDITDVPGLSIDRAP